MNKENKAVEKVVERMYKDHLQKTGALPDKKLCRVFEEKAKKGARLADRKKGR